MTINDKFPDYFPSCCPPENAIDANGAVFRVVKNEDLTSDDFLSHHELETAITANPCSRCGVSVFNSFQKALHLQRMRPTLGNAIAEGNLNPSAGKMLLTIKSGHIDWWSYDGVERQSFFGKPKLCT